MSKNISHEEIAQKFVDEKAFDFTNIGKILTELGPTLAAGDNGLHGVIFGRYNSIACFMPAFDVAHVLGALRGSGLAGTIAEDVAKSK
jgi:hypothetical protein